MHGAQVLGEDVEVGELVHGEAELLPDAAVRIVGRDQVALRAVAVRGEPDPVSLHVVDLDEAVVRGREVPGPLLQDRVVHIGQRQRVADDLEPLRLELTRDVVEDLAQRVGKLRPAEDVVGQRRRPEEKPVTP